MSEPAFKNKKLENLDEKWSQFRDSIQLEEEPAYSYQELMVETFPIIYEGWNNKSDVIDKDIARLSGTLMSVFCGLYDDDGNFLGNPDYEDESIVLNSILEDLMFLEGLEFDSDGNLLVQDFLVNPKTFEIDWCLNDEDE
jgi:hypothetical protein